MMQREKRHATLGLHNHPSMRDLREVSFGTTNDSVQQRPRKKTSTLSIRAIRWLTFLYVVAFLLAMTWPGFLIFNHVKPLVLGLPFNLFCIALFIIVGMGVLFLLYHAEDRHNETHDTEER